MALWHNGSASDSRSEGKVFESLSGQNFLFIYFLYKIRNYQFRQSFPLDIDPCIIKRTKHLQNYIAFIIKIDFFVRPTIWYQTIKSIRIMFRSSPYGAMVARLTPDQKVRCSSHSRGKTFYLFIFYIKFEIIDKAFPSTLTLAL